MSDFTDWPELVFGLVGPIGVNMDIVERKLSEALTSVGYKSHRVRLTELMTEIAIDGVELTDSTDPYVRYKSRIDYANAVRTKCENDAALAALAISEIRRTRANHWEGTRPGTDLEGIPIDRLAYILRQLKRSEEIQLLRKVYGRKFVQISIHASERDRLKNLERSIALSNPHLSPADCADAAEFLVTTDMHERSDIHGQRIEEVFHLGDVFINGKNEDSISRTMDRFIDALFGKNSISPNRDEYGAYIAASASLRSIDLSRQVGAAVFSSRGEVISLGCNEVPKFSGGTYWTDDPDPHRDFEDGVDANRTEKNRIIYDFLRTLEEASALKQGATAASLFADEEIKNRIRTASVSDITEFGRMTHAEMTALCDAARLGRATAGATIFVTTFPCHNCAKHIIASGIRRVVFIEPYPKSKALDFHEDSAVLDEKHDQRVMFDHFVGISPRRYRDIFEKASRRGPGGKIAEWYRGQPMPMLEDKGPAYIWNEDSAIYSTLLKVANELGIEITPHDPPLDEDQVLPNATQL
ncbi:deoxycytidylate deaminase [Mesorhizobium ephedrae]|uniref:Deoxycytidylate deaminase n=1 Tax=Kumtagia ephedrae TaxID=2116701 RepID=A0A2P7SPU3_9HYPH|nr:deoxycytidylate deaminase [Mesorhizobium ephedrae]